MRSPGHQHADKRDDVQRYEEENGRWQDRKEFFLQLLEYFVHGAAIVTARCPTRKQIPCNREMANLLFDAPAIEIISYSSGMPYVCSAYTRIVVLSLMLSLLQFA